MIAFMIFGALALVGLVGMLVQRARTAAALRRERRTPVPLVIPVTRGVQAPTPWRPPATPAEGAPVQMPAAAYAEGATAPRRSGVAAGANGSGSYGGGAARGADYASMETPDSVRRQSAAAAAASEGTLQLLPGRFEVVAGMDGGRDIRFVRGPGGTPEVTLGRMDGPTYRHVQLPAQTVSRMHARMRFEGGRWQISNLSPTNPVVVNGEPLDADGESRLLAEGDRVELGEVVLRFRERA
jgi:predicted component of type VI protein secretion system